VRATHVPLRDCQRSPRPDDVDDHVVVRDPLPSVGTVLAGLSGQLPLDRLGIMATDRSRPPDTCPPLGRQQSFPYGSSLTSMESPWSVRCGSDPLRWPDVWDGPRPGRDRVGGSHGARTAPTDQHPTRNRALLGDTRLLAWTAAWSVSCGNALGVTPWQVRTTTRTANVVASLPTAGSAKTAVRRGCRRGTRGLAEGVGRSATQSRPNGRRLGRSGGGGGQWSSRACRPRISPRGWPVGSSASPGTCCRPAAAPARSG